MTLKLSVLDQSFARRADQAHLALQETLQMAQWCEQLGYQRFWVSEHHAFPNIAGSAPEVLLAALGQVTSTIRLGSGGIMLPHYSAYKIAEVFSLLGNLYPGRIDLGIGRAPGADMSTAVVLATDGRPKFERFPQLVEELTNYLRKPVSKPLLSPQPPADLPIWMLGSSADSAVLAGERGLPYNLGLFINPHANADLIEIYRGNFKASKQLAEPYVIVTMGAFCCDTQAEAIVQQKTFDINFFRFVTGQINSTAGEGWLPPESIENYPMLPQLQAFIDERSGNRAVGTPAQVHAKISAIAERYTADEVMVVTNMFEFESRKRSFELLMSGFA